MYKNYELWIPLEKIPTGTAQQKGEQVVNGRIHHFTKKKVTETANLLIKELDEAMKDSHPDFIPFDEGEAIGLAFTFHYPTKTKKRWGMYKTSRPDNDNLVKLPNDCITKMGWWHDDSQIAFLQVVKKWVPADKGGIGIKMWRLRS